jgi:glutathione S-transferase
MTARDTFDLTITRTIRATRQRVFDAFVNPELLKQWFAPRGFAVLDAIVDPRVGGRYRMTMKQRSGEPVMVSGEYREVKAPERLTFTWKWESAPMAALPETLVTVSLVERRGEHGVETEITLLHTGFPAPEARDGHTLGWSSSVNRLADSLDERGTTASITVVGNPRSSYVWATRLALAEKGVKYTLLPVRPHCEEVLALNPFGHVPAFRDGDLTLFETSAIIRYLDECFDDPPLVARNAVLRAMMEQWTSAISFYCYDAMVRRYVLQYIFPKAGGGAPDRATIDAAVPAIKMQLGIFDQAYGPRNVLVGDTLTLPDLLLAPIVFYVGRFPEGKAMLAEAPNVSRAHAWIAARPSFRETTPELA